MRLGGGNQFDLTDAEVTAANTPVDTVATVVELAIDVLADYGGEDTTRIARMARWIVLNLAGDGANVPSLGRDYSHSTNRLIFLDERHCTGYSPDNARVLAKMILREVEIAETDD